MKIDENEYFREAALRICGNLDFEKAMQDFIKYLRQFMPVDSMYLGLFDLKAGAMRALAAVSKEDIGPPEFISYYPEDIMANLRKYDKRENLVVRLNNPFLTPELKKSLRLPQREDQSFLAMKLWKKDKETALVVIQANGWNQHTAYHEHLLKILHDIFRVAATNILHYRKVTKLQEMLIDENRYLKEELNRESTGVVIGKKQGLKNVMAQVNRVSWLDNPVLLLGETGVGKEMIANAIHYSSPRKNGPFVKVNSGAIPENLMDSELFGHEKGAFTGALSLKRGRFERAHKGTIFLDEIGELTPQAQVRLLRVIQYKLIERVGGSEPIPIDVRIISATHRNLDEMVKSGAFREDLLYRLNVYPIMIPPLRQRKEDISALVQHFIRKKSMELRLETEPYMAPGAMDRLKSYHWPGNVRELENVVERELIQSAGDNGADILTFNNVVPNIGEEKEITPLEDPDKELLPLDEVIATYISKALRLTKGRIYGSDGAAEHLKIHPNTLRSRMKKLGIPFGFGKI